MEISDKELAILGMIYENPMYGYEIEKVMQETSMNDWTEIAFSSIYFLLKRLESKNLIISKIEQNEKNQTRKIYSTTEIGKQQTKEKLKDILSHHEKTIWQIDLGMAYQQILSQKEVKECLLLYEEEIDKSIVCYKELQKYLSDHECPQNRLQLAQRPMRLFEAEKEWIHTYIQSLDE